MVNKSNRRKNNVRKTSQKKRKDRKWRWHEKIVLILVIAGFFYIVGYCNAFYNANKQIKEFYDGKSIASVDVDFRTEINNITVSSDLNNFTHITNLMYELRIDKSRYPNLNGIIYYQNKSVNGYYSFIEDGSCDGSYYPVGNYIALYKCDGPTIIREYNVSKEYSEKFILLHELGHYEGYNNVDYQQKTADIYAKENIQ